MDPFCAGAALHRSTPPDFISSVHCASKDNYRVRINVAGYQKGERQKKRQANALEGLSAALLLSLRGQHGEKMTDCGENPG